MNGFETFTVTCTWAKASGQDVEGEEDKGRAAKPAGQKSLDDKVRGKKSGGAPARTLEEITIEGEIAVPQVLFITARDRRRYNDQLYRKFLQSSLELARGTAYPRHLVIRP